MRSLRPINATDAIGRDVELGVVSVTPGDVARYASAVGDRALARNPGDVAPLGFLLAMRGGPVPAVDLSPDTVSVHGGHDIRAHRALTAPGVYSVRARVTEVFEKSGRSGRLTVIGRRAEIRAADGALVATVDDQQIVRPRPTGGAPAPRAAAADRPDGSVVVQPVPAKLARLEVGDLLAVQRRLAPSAGAIATYADRLAGGERVFTDRRFAQGLGHADVIVPGPLQSALLESFLRRRLPGWTLHRLSLTFRVSLTAREPIVLAAVVVEHDDRSEATTLHCDLSLENRDGERAAVGMAELSRTTSP